MYGRVKNETSQDGDDNLVRTVAFAIIRGDGCEVEPETRATR